MTSVIQQQTTNVSTSPVYKGSRWSKSGTYLAMGGASGATYIYKRSGNTLTLLSSALSGTALAGNIYDVDFSQNDTYFGVYSATQSGSSFTAFYKNNGNDTFTRLSTPATTVAPGSRALDAISFSPSSPLVAMAMNASPWLEIQTYDTGTDTFTKCTLAGTPPSVALSGVRFSPDGNYLAVVSASGIIVYRVSLAGTTVTLTPCTQSSGTVPGSGAFGVAWHPSSQYFAVFQNTAAASILVMKITGTTTFAQLSATIPQLYTSTSNISGDWSSDGRRIVGRDGSSNIYIWNFNSDETITFDVSFAGVAAGTAANRVRLSPDGGSMLITAGDTTGTTFAQFYSDYNKNGIAELFPALTGQVSATGQRAFWSQDGKYLFLSIRGASPGLYIYKRVGNTFTKLPASALVGSLTWGDGRPGDYSRENKYVAFSSQSSNNLVVLKNNGDDTFTRVFNPTLAGAPNAVSFSRTQNILCVAMNASPYVAFYKYDPSTDTFTALSLTGAVTALETAPWQVQFSPDNNWLLASYGSTAAYRLYQITAIDLTANTITLTSIAKPASGEPAQQSDWAAFDPTSTYFAVFTRTTNSGPFVYKISGGSYTKLANQPPAPRTSGTYVVHGSWHPNGRHLYMTSSETQARLYAFDFASETFTSQITTDWPNLGGGGESAQIGPKGQFLATTTNSAPFLTMWSAVNDVQVDAATFPVFGTPNSSAKFKSTITSVTKLAAASNIAASGGAQVKFSPDGNYLSYTASVTPFSRMFSRSGDTFTPLSNFSTGQPNVATSKPEWFSDSTHLILNWLNGSNYWNQYLNNSGTFTISNSYLGTQPNAIRLSPDSTLAIAVLASSPWIRMFNVNANSTVGTEYTITWVGGTPGSAINDVAISSDNKKIAFGFNNVVESTRVYDVTAINTASATITLTKRSASSDQTATNTTTCLKFNQDNVHLAVATTSTVAGTAGAAVYNVPNTVGSAYSRVNLLVGATDTEAAKAVAWSADGTRLMAAFTNNFGVCDYVVSNDKAGALVLPDVSPTSPIVWGDLSADGRYAAITSSASPTLTFYKVVATASVSITATLPSFSAQGSVYANGLMGSVSLPALSASGNVKVNLMNVDLQTSPSLTINDNPVISTALSPDGNYFAVNTSNSSSLYVYTRSGTTLGSRVTVDTGLSFRSMAWSPDSTYLVGASTNNSGVGFYKNNKDGTFTRLTTAGLSGATCVAWHPSGNLVAVGYGTSPYIALYSRSGDTFTRVTGVTFDTPPAAVWGIAWSPDGNTLGVTMNNTSPYLSFYNFNGVSAFTLNSPSVTFSFTNAHSIDFSSDGTYVAILANSGTSKVYKFNQAAGVPYGTPITIPNANNTLDGSGLTGSAGKAVKWFNGIGKVGYLLYVSSTSPYVHIAMLNIAAQTLTELTVPANITYASSGDVSISSDGQYLMAGTHVGTFNWFSTDYVVPVSANVIATFPALAVNGLVTYSVKANSSSVFPVFGTSGRVNVATEITGVETFPTFSASAIVGAYPKEYPEAISWKPTSVVQASTPITFSEAEPDNPAAFGTEVFPKFAINSQISVRINVDPNGEPLTYPAFATNGVIAVGLITVNPDNEAFTFPAFTANGNLFDKINVSGPVTFPAFNVRSTVKLMNEVNGNVEFPAFTTDGQVLWETLEGDVDFPAFQTVGEVKVTYTVSSDAVFPVFTAEGTVEWITVSGTETFPQFQTNGSVDVPVGVEGSETFPTFTVNALSSVQQKLSGSPTFPGFKTDGQIGATNHVDARPIFPKFQINSNVGNIVFVNPNDEAFTFPTFGAEAEVENYYKLTGNMTIKLSMSGNMFRGKPHTLFHVIEN